ncbi:hypothetical protein ACIBO5_17875 [Nonomuraea angiospora]|uniref:hypothetical protein n=1 Tax=Nonomuraea angiospora TaxID=46172 RepID=UPI003799CFAD
MTTLSNVNKGSDCRICLGDGIQSSPALLYVLAHPGTSVACVGVTGLDLISRLGHLFRCGWQIHHMAPSPRRQLSDTLVSGGNPFSRISLKARSCVSYVSVAAVTLPQNQ